MLPAILRLQPSKRRWSKQVCVAAEPVAGYFVNRRYNGFAIGECTSQGRDTTAHLH